MKAAQTAVILIEFQNEFCKEAGKLYGAAKGELARNGTIAHAVRLLKGAREKGCLVVHCPFVFDEAWAQARCVCGIIAGAKEGGAFRPGDWGTRFIDELQPAAGEVVLTGKHALSAFTNTQLARVLEEGGIRHVACAGFLTNVCVESTARSAYDRGYGVTIVRDACCATSQANQQYVEREIAPVLGGAMSVEELLASLEQENEP